MVVVEREIRCYLSGGATNSNQHAALGGVISTHDDIPTEVLGNLFSDVSAAEATAGSVKYRCYYVKNTGVDTWFSVDVWVQTDTPSAGTEIDIGLDPAGAGNGVSTGVATTVANETTAPGGVVFTHPTSSPGVSIGDLTAGQCAAVWLRRTVTAGATAAVIDNVLLRHNGSDV